ncbi:MAG TPA: DUF2066 domain-containing protein [Rhodanobacteraceae bacterium]|nr:DUF2066 domain-containing protein [Rhodanobacteraceae bacterium]
MRVRLPEADVRPLSLDRCRLAVVFMLAFACVLALARPVRAGPPTYTGEAPVNTQSDDERAEALKTALASVVIDQTGDSGVLARSDVAAAVAKAERYVLQFRYKRATVDGAGPPLVLVAEFDSAAVDDMLQKLGLKDAIGTAPLDATPSEATVWISGIRSAEQYARVIAYLGKSNLVRGAQPREARGDGLLVKLSLATDLRHFLDAVGMERMLTVVNAAPPVEGVDATLALGQ